MIDKFAESKSDDILVVFSNIDNSLNKDEPIFDIKYNRHKNIYMYDNNFDTVISTLLQINSGYKLVSMESGFADSKDMSNCSIMYIRFNVDENFGEKKSKSQKLVVQKSKNCQIM